MPLRNIKAILFDLDGTLVDSNNFHVQAWEEAFRTCGIAVERRAIHDQIGKGADNLIPALAPDADEETRSKLDGVQGDIYKSRHLGQVRPFPGARDLLQRVHDAGCKVVLASSASRTELDAYVALLQAEALVTATTCADDVKSSKPAPDIFAAALHKVAPTKPDEALVIGDTPYDVEAARKCGISAVAVRSGGFSDKVLAEAGAIALYNDVAALLLDYENSPLVR